MLPRCLTRRCRFLPYRYSAAHRMRQAARQEHQLQAEWSRRVELNTSAQRWVRNRIRISPLQSSHPLCGQNHLHPPPQNRRQGGGASYLQPNAQTKHCLEHRAAMNTATSEGQVVGAESEGWHRIILMVTRLLCLGNSSKVFNIFWLNNNQV